MAFPATVSFPATVIFPHIPPFLTNVQKFSLPANTPVGTRVQVTDGFVVSGAIASEWNTFWFPHGTINGRVAYDFFGNTSFGEGTIAVYWSGTQWELNGGDHYAVGDTEFPWQADWAPIGYPYPLTLTHPAVQQLAAPSTEQGGVFVPELGIYTIRGQFGGKSWYGLLGQEVSAGDAYSVTWATDRWFIYDNAGDPLYYSLSDVATPDLASNWKNASDDSPASITVTSVTQGELDAGVTVVGAGTASISGLVEVDGQYSKTGNFNSEPFYNLIGHSVNVNQHSIWSAGESDPYWSIADSEDIGGFTGFPGTVFPWQPTWGATDSNPPAPTVTRNDVASEANWINI
jgi:hypothetical protein